MAHIWLKADSNYVSRDKKQKFNIQNYNFRVAALRQPEEKSDNFLPKRY